MSGIVLKLDRKAKLNDTNIGTIANAVGASFCISTISKVVPPRLVRQGFSLTNNTVNITGT